MADEAIRLYRREKEASAKRNSPRIQAERARLQEAVARITELPPREKARRRRVSIAAKASNRRRGQAA